MSPNFACPGSNSEIWKSPFVDTGLNGPRTSRGASGFWVEHGVIAYPVDEVTIAGQLRDMFQRIVAVGSDIDRRGSILTGSILLEKMMVAGS